MTKFSVHDNFNQQKTNYLCKNFHPFSLDDCILSPKRIDIWQYPLNQEVEDAFNILNDEEKTRAKRFYFNKHQRRFIISHAILRLILARYLQNKNPNSIEFSKNKYNKPELKNNPSNLQFNLSHSGEWALLAVGQEYPLGVDIEIFSNREYIDLAKTAFSKSEILALEKTNKKALALTFFRIWSQKEAFIKACGLGLSYPTQKFSVPHFMSNKHEIIDNKNGSKWQITSFIPTLTSCGAICHNPNVKEIRYLVLR